MVRCEGKQCTFLFPECSCTGRGIITVEIDVFSFFLLFFLQLGKYNYRDYMMRWTTLTQAYTHATRSSGDK